MKCSTHVSNLPIHEGDIVIGLQNTNVSAEIHLNDVGTIFKIKVLNQAGVIVPVIGDIVEIKFKKPDYTTQTVNPLINIEGVLSFTSTVGFLDKIGTWKMQAKVINTDGTWYSNITEFEVHNNL